MLCLSACSSTGYRVQQQKLLSSLKNNNISSAKDVVNGKDFYNEKRNEFLNNVEKGTVYYLDKSYFQALKYFEKAEAICNESSIKIKNKLKAGFNTNLDYYYCERYEKSMLYFYLSLVHYNIYYTGRYENFETKDKDGKKVIESKKMLNNYEKLLHLEASRSVVMSWDSLLSSYKKEFGGKSVYKDDMIAKLWGGYIHEQFDNFENRQIALQLYKDAKNVLLKNYNIYPVFNKKNDLFEKNYNKFYNMDLTKIKKNYIENTEFASELLEFIDEKIKKLSSHKKDNFTIILKEDFISAKKAKKVGISIPLDILILGGDDKAGILEFSLMALSSSPDGLPTIEFELPYIEEKQVNNNYYVVILNKNKSKIVEFPIVLANPNSSIAYDELKNKMTALYSKIATNVATKHALALISAYSIYKQNPSTGVLLSALLSYKIAAATINESTKADLRYWVSLADNIRIGSTLLQEGDYFVEIYKQSKNGLKHKVKTENIKVDGEGVLLDVNL